MRLNTSCQVCTSEGLAQHGRVGLVLTAAVALVILALSTACSTTKAFEPPPLPAVQDMPDYTLINQNNYYQYGLRVGLRVAGVMYWDGQLSHIMGGSVDRPLVVAYVVSTLSNESTQKRWIKTCQKSGEQFFRRFNDEKTVNLQRLSLTEGIANVDAYDAYRGDLSNRLNVGIVCLRSKQSAADVMVLDIDTPGTPRQLTNAVSWLLKKWEATP